ncbi:phage tail tape measure protein [Streptomyces brevispora]|uniref:Phage tail tape measure protein n=1 Tax=Streptomyces brevispora TaxID=887462 RepID=A0ABZ1G892_9ACTN|nr:phage tail tape measure protein [Streptomyces brevispora]WSC14898.1 phage tail tape measure protein [Streptomyces brevispora]
MSRFGQQLDREIGEPVARASNRAGTQGGESLMSTMKAKVLVGAAAVGAAAGAVLVKGLETSMEKQKATGKLKAQLGLSVQDAKRAGQAAGKLYGDTVAESVDEAAAAVRATMSAGLAPPKATTKQLAQISTKVQDLQTLFEVDLGQAANAAGQAVKNGLAKSGGEALDVMYRGFQIMGPRADDLADTFNEYSTIFRSLGLDMKTTTGILSQGMKAGARDTDVVADALKEFQIRTTDGSTTSAEGFKLLGMNAEKATKVFAKGGKGAANGLQLVLDKLRNLKDPVDRNAAAVALFGTKAEDMGQALFKLDPSKAVKDLGKVGGAAKRAGDDLRSSAGVPFEQFKRRALMAIGDVAAKYVLPRLMKFGRYLNSDVLPVVRKVGGFVSTNVVPAVKSFGSALASGARWVREYGVWFTPLIAGVGTLATLLYAGAAAAAVNTAATATWASVTGAATVVTNAFKAAQMALRVVWLSNPIFLVIAGVIALGVALVVAYKKSETFRAIVQGAWAGIKAGWTALWEQGLKPGFGYLMTGLSAIGTAASWLWTTVLKPVFGWIAVGAKILATVMYITLVMPIMFGVKTLGAGFSWLWTAAIKPVLGWIAAGAKWLWTAAIKPAFAAIMASVRAVGAAGTWLWKNALSPVFGWIGSGARILWGGLKTQFGYVKAGLSALGAAGTWLWKNALSPAFKGIGAVASWLYTKGIKPPIDKAKELAKSLGEAFKSGADAVGKAFKSIQDKAKKPITYVIDTVYNKGIRGVWNTVAGKFGAPTLPAFKGFARGGVLPGQSSYRDGDDQLVPMRRGEGVAVSEAMRDPYERSRLLAVNKAAMQGRSLSPFQGEGFSKGGIFGWVKNTASKGVDLAASGVDWLKDGVKASAVAGLTAVVKPLINKISGSASAYREMISGIPTRMIKEIVGYSGKADSEMEKAGIGGAGFKGALAWARTQAGKAYQWGGNGNPSWDCSGFVSAIESVIRGQKPHRRWATGSFSGEQAPSGWVRGAKSPYMIGITNAGVGHTAGTINGVNVESRGGDGVVVGSRARSYMDPLFTDRYGLRGFADGGRPRRGELAWVGERGPELLRFGGGDTEVYDHQRSMRMAAGLGPVRGFAKGTKVKATVKKPSRIATDLVNFKDSLTGTATQIAAAAKKLTTDLTAAGKAGKTLAKATTAASTKLQTMAKQRDAVSARIKEAKSYAADKAGSMADFLGLSNFGDAASVGDLISGLKGRQDTAKGFQAQLAKVQKRGGSKDLIAQLVEMGPDSPLAGLVAGSNGADFKQINTLVKSGGSLSKAYGNGLADLMFDAGKDASKGFLAGLLGQEKAIQQAMTKLGAGAIKAVRSKKGIDAHSPSRKGAAAGADVGAGVVAGMAAMLPGVESQAERMAAAAVPRAAVVPVTSTRPGAQQDGALQRGDTVVLRIGESEFEAVVDRRVDSGLATVRRTLRAGNK